MVMMVVKGKDEEREIERRWRRRRRRSHGAFESYFCGD